MDNTTINSIIGVFATVITVGCTIIGIKVAKSKKTITVSKKTKLYLNPNNKGSFVFDYSNNNGTYTIGSDEYIFNTKWSSASNSSIHAYKDNTNIDCIALIESVGDIESKIDFNADFSSRARTARIGDAILWKNTNGKYALTKIISVSAKSHGADADTLECEYIIFK